MNGVQIHRMLPVGLHSEAQGVYPYIHADRNGKKSNA